MHKMGTNWDLPQKRRFPASSFEFRLFLYKRSFRYNHPPLAYMQARAHIRRSGGRTYGYMPDVHYGRINTHVRIPAQCTHWWT